MNHSNKKMKITAAAVRDTELPTLQPEEGDGDGDGDGGPVPFTTQKYELEYVPPIS